MEQKSNKQETYTGKMTMFPQKAIQVVEQSSYQTINPINGRQLHQE